MNLRNLRIREDTAKYLLNLDVNSAYYDPKTRSMREDPLPDADANEKFYCVCSYSDNFRYCFKETKNNRSLFKVS